MKKDDEKRDKKAYEAPRLSVYGDLRKMTKAVGGTGLSDGGLTAMKTSV
jgi:hypothetical protein